MNTASIEKTAVMGRPSTVMNEANSNLKYMIEIYKHFNHDIERILESLDVAYITFYRWNTNTSMPRLRKHLNNLERFSGYSSDEIRLQHLKLDVEKNRG